jgi:hypothetical protein
VSRSPFVPRTRALRPVPPMSIARVRTERIGAL